MVTLHYGLRATLRQQMDLIARLFAQHQPAKSKTLKASSSSSVLPKKAAPARQSKRSNSFDLGELKSAEISDETLEELRRSFENLKDLYEEEDEVESTLDSSSAEETTCPRLFVKFSDQHQIFTYDQDREQLISLMLGLKS